MNLTRFLFEFQDKAALFIIFAAVVLIACFLAWRSTPEWGATTFGAPKRFVWVAILFTIVVCLLGHTFVFGGYAFTRDEMLVLFDAEVFANGHLAAVLPPAFRPHPVALQPELVQWIPAKAFFLTAYLPMNALLHVPGYLLGHPGITGAILAGVSVLATFAAARRLAPENPIVAAVAAFLVATSPQVLITGMTAYAFNAHLALNMVFLWCLLGTSARSAVGAVAVGFVLTGLHQFIFPLLFAAPFILAMYLRPQRIRALVIGSALVFAVLVWVQYPTFVIAGVADAALGSQGNAVASGQTEALGRLQSIISHVWHLLDQKDRFEAMGYNLVRFIAWQNPALILFAAFALWRLWSRPALWPLWSGLVLALVVIGLVQPNQTHGWGYRYIHGHIGALAIMAGYGFHEARTLAGRWPAMRAMVLPLGVTSVALTLPLLALTTWMLTSPFRLAQRQIAAMDADMVLVNWHGIAYGPDLVRNRPFLSRPINLNPLGINRAEIKTLCQQGTLAFFDYDPKKNAGLPWLPTDIPPEKADVLDKQWYRDNGCRVVN